MQRPFSWLCTASAGYAGQPADRRVDGEARDPYTGGHLWRVSQFAMILAAKAGLPAAEVQRIAVAGFLHDLGKIGVPDAILGKPGRLTEEEYAVIKTHPRIGSRMLAGHPLHRWSIARC